ncbi:MAG: hypothetical protein AAGF45_06985 [Pseudomonadota bacterium]
MKSGADVRDRRRAHKTARGDLLTELPMVAALLVTAVVVAAVTAGGPVIDMLSGLKTMWGG